MKPQFKRYAPEALHRELYNRSELLTRSAHTLTIAADQLVRAHGRDYLKAALAVRSAAMSAILAAMSAFELVGAYDLASWLGRRSRSE